MVCTKIPLPQRYIIFSETTKIRQYILHFRKIYVSLQGISTMATRRAMKKWNAENDTLPIYD